jgi:hypothetical protein
MRIECFAHNDPLSQSFYDRVLAIVKDIGFKRAREYGVEVGVDERGIVYIQVLCDRPDTYTGEFGTGRGGRRLLFEAQSDSSIVRTVLAAFLAYEEHEVREAFQYKGKRIYGPHIDVEALVEVADRIEGQP